MNTFLIFSHCYVTVSIHPFAKLSFQSFKDVWKSEQARIAKEILKEERLRLKMKAESLRDFKTEPRKPKGLKEKMLKRRARQDKDD